MFYMAGICRPRSFFPRRGSSSILPGGDISAANPRERELTITAPPAPNAPPARLKVRKNIDSLSVQELADLRRAIKQPLGLNDKRGFDYFAGLGAGEPGRGPAGRRRAVVGCGKCGPFG